MTPPRVLLVEDSRDQVILFLHALENGGRPVDVVVARTGIEALDRLRLDDDGEQVAASVDEPPPSLVLLDLDLPGRSGIEVLERIRASPRTRHVPVVVLTSSDEERDVQAAYEAGANSYVTKPVGFEKLQELVARIVDYWTGLNHPPTDL